jgi:hypothetical protein
MTESNHWASWCQPYHWASWCQPLFLGFVVSAFVFGFRSLICHWASWCQPLFLVFGRSVVYRMVAKTR